MLDRVAEQVEQDLGESVAAEGDLGPVRRGDAGADLAHLERITHFTEHLGSVGLADHALLATGTGIGEGSLAQGVPLRGALAQRHQVLRAIRLELVAMVF